MSIDLHIHSNASDGDQTAAQIVEHAVARGLTALSICDHDSLAANAPAAAAAQGSIAYLPGVEISAIEGHAEVHILGYFVAPDYAPLRDELQHVRQERAARIERTVERLQKLGIGITLQDIMEVARLEPGHDTALGRPHVAAALVKIGAVASPVEAFALYLKRGRPAYLDRYRLQPDQALALVREAGGLSVLAHPGLLRDDRLIADLVAKGLRGLEAYHTAHTARDTERYLKLAEKLGLYVTGGTDSHGPTGSYPVEIGGLDVPDVLAEKLIQWKTAQANQGR